MRWFGDADLDKKVIRINVKKNKQVGKNLMKVPGKKSQRVSRGELLDTLVHETLHVKYPKKSETKIQKLAEKKMKVMSKKQRAKYYNLIK